ncbi:NAD(P)/FAD-dependent oxidoreductase [Paenibacillus endoradicis]|uniref:NAD(P)/FAD-dependent oxidoreductase n=1 Tax=Paenibacillus endoradicis TaxID=2972487 RepID=UPI0021596447|nr:NAD(P)/FAD-dependent oxidoreductase [Paenibacillus endoradicis]MCR8658785.1 NAD(P)/FAD-dependent oxidoreductase [Paenibacillus endoradicis]
MENRHILDVTIVGGGPAGLYAAFYGGLREMSIKIIEFQPYLGGKVHIYPEKMIWDVGGLKPIPGAQLIEQLVSQARTFEPEVVLGQKVISVSRGEDGIFELLSATGERHYAKTIIFAVGGGILKPTKLNIEGAERFEVSNLHYTVKSLAHFKNKTVLISGGGNAAIDWANELEPIAEKVYLTYRSDMLKGHEAEISRLRNSSAELLLNTTIETLVAADNHESIERVILKKNDDNEQLELAVDEVIINHGYEREMELLKQSELKIELEEDYWIAGTPMSETSVEGIYAAGDILHHEGKLHLIAGAFQDAANAINKAKQFITPDARANGMVSSHNELFKQKNKELLKELLSK